MGVCIVTFYIKISPFYVRMIILTSTGFLTGGWSHARTGHFGSGTLFFYFYVRRSFTINFCCHAQFFDWGMVLAYGPVNKCAVVLYYCTTLLLTSFQSKTGMPDSLIGGWCWRTYVQRTHTYNGQTTNLDRQYEIIAHSFLVWQWSNQFESPTTASGFYCLCWLQQFFCLTKHGRIPSTSILFLWQSQTGLWIFSSSSCAQWCSRIIHPALFTIFMAVLPLHSTYF